MLYTIFNEQLNLFDRYSARRKTSDKIQAILYTLPENLIFEDIIKAVDNKLDFDTIVKESYRSNKSEEEEEDYFDDEL